MTDRGVNLLGWVTFWRPQLHWYGWQTLIPVYFGRNESGWRTVVLGWTVTGRIAIALTSDTARAIRKVKGYLGAEEGGWLDEDRNEGVVETFRDEFLGEG